MVPTLNLSVGSSTHHSSNFEVCITKPHLWQDWILVREGFPPRTRCQVRTESQRSSSFPFSFHSFIAYYEPQSFRFEHELIFTAGPGYLCNVTVLRLGLQERNPLDSTSIECARVVCSDTLEYWIYRRGHVRAAGTRQLACVLHLANYIKPLYSL